MTYDEFRLEIDITQRLAADLISRIIRKTIPRLQKSSTTLSEDDSGLKNTWDEICVQVQYEESFFWEEYKNIIRGIVFEYVRALKEYEKTAIWLQTEDGEDWDGEYEENDPMFLDEDLAEYIINKILDEAEEWSNRRIRKYLDAYL